MAASAGGQAPAQRRRSCWTQANSSRAASTASIPNSTCTSRPLSSAGSRPAWNGKLSTASGRIDAIFYDYNRSSGLMGAVHGQVAPKGATMARTVIQRGIAGDAQPPRGPGHTPFMGDYLGIDSTANLVAVSWTGNGPASQDVYAATLLP
jgi:hypothetical protein